MSLKIYDVARRALVDNPYKKRKNLTRKRLERAIKTLELARASKALTYTADPLVESALVLLRDALDKQTPFMELIE